MKVYIDVDSGLAVTTPGIPTALKSLVIKRSTAVRLDVQFIRGGTVVELAPGAAGIWELKEVDEYDSEPVAGSSSWVKSGEGTSTVYSFDFTLASDDLNELLGVNVSSSDDVGSIKLMGEIQWDTGGSKNKTQTISVTVLNDVIREGDEIPAWTATTSIDPVSLFLGVTFLRSGASGVVPHSRLIVSVDGATWNPISDDTVFGDYFLEDMSITFRDNLWYVASTVDVDYTGVPLDNAHMGMLTSPDLKNWTARTGAGRPDFSGIATSLGNNGAVWAPDFYNEPGQPLIVYASVSKSEVFDDSNALVSIAAFKIYESHSTNSDHTTWSTPTLVYDPGDSICVIDPHVFKRGDTYIMLIKNQNVGGLNGVIEELSSSSPYGPFTPVSGRTGDWLGSGGNVEGPSRLKISDTHERYYYDHYNGQGIYYVDSFDGGATFEDPVICDTNAITAGIAMDHPGFFKIETLTHAVQVLGLAIGQRNERLMRPSIRGSVNHVTVWPSFGDVGRRVCYGIVTALDGSRFYEFGTDLSATGTDTFGFRNSTNGDLAFINENATGKWRLVKGAVIAEGAFPFTGDSPSASLEVISTTKGFLPPRMTTTQRDAISSPAEGLVIYNTTTGKLNVKGASAWEAVTSA